MTSAPTDEIYEKYLQKAITEINELGDEVIRAGTPGGAPVLGSGHPLGDVFLLKYRPRPAEVQEGVAFLVEHLPAQVRLVIATRTDPALPLARMRGHGRLVELRDAGVAILLVSVELEEVMALSDRILALCGGRIIGERAAERADERELGLLMAGVTDEAA